MNYPDAVSKLYEADEFATALIEGILEPVNDTWDDDVAEIAILERFVKHYAALDNAIDAARAEHDYNDDRPIVFVWDSERMELVRFVPHPAKEGI
ncbi:hypothetical protein ACFVU2_20985 [Leifsonia sp. NPDC058194]|uniref:hypothetical protein n=1 Tax=Leifsonia sp. NPDC058194 TaxID=3346374 RepID=UPI0036DC76C0